MLNRRGTAIIGVITFALGLNALGADKSWRGEVVGAIVGAQGSVLVDHAPALPHEAVFSGDVISTGVASGAYLNLRGATAILVQNAEMALAGPGRPATMTLVKGAVVVRTNGFESARVNVPGAFVLVGGRGTEPASIRIAAVKEAAVVVADRGQAEIHGAGAPAIVRAGKTVRLENGVPQGGAVQRAGAIYRQIPTGFLSPTESGPGTPLKLNDAVYWNNWVLTPGNGRVQILLGDGSYLNVGARSKMHVIRHDAQSHETELEITAGSVRAAVQKVAGSRFKATTPTAVIGVTGTILQADVLGANQTNVTSIQDDVTVGSTNPNITQIITLHTGQMVSVTPTGFSAVTNVTSGLMRATQNRTAIKDGLNGPANAATQQLARQITTAPGGVSGAAGVTGAVSSTATNITNLGVAGVGAGLSGGALSNINSTGSSLNQVSNNAGNAQSAANSATSAVSQTTNVENTTATQIQQAQQNCGCPSPSSPAGRQ